MKILGIYGYGKMGKAIEGISLNYAEIVDCKIFQRGENLEEFVEKSDYIVDFSNNDGTKFLVEYLYNNKIPKILLIGSTALSAEIMSKIKLYSEIAPVLYAPNVSIGANILAIFSQKLSKILSDGYDIDIIDIHHRQKLDAPSGTALMIADYINNESEPKKKIITNRAETGARSENEISIASIRSGNFAGEHIVNFSGKWDNITISHKAEKRELFADGAIKAILWLRHQKNSLYSMKDMLDTYLI